MNIQDLKNCPKCDYQWKSNKNIYEEFRENPSYKDMTDEQVKEVASHYGHTEANPQYFSKLVGIELPYDHPDYYDGVSRWMCPNCKNEWNRWTGKLIDKDFHDKS
jgi:hypothetical protein